MKAVGQILRSSVREDDVAARYGGEEFVVVYPGATKAQALALAENLRQAVESHAFTHGGRQPAGRVTLSGGVATYPEDSRSCRELVAMRRPGALRGQGRRAQPHRRSPTQLPDVAGTTPRRKPTGAATVGSGAVLRFRVARSTAVRIRTPPARRPVETGSPRIIAPSATATTGLT